jgi:hypothetical protein
MIVGSPIFLTASAKPEGGACSSFADRTLPFCVGKSAISEEEDTCSVDEHECGVEEGEGVGHRREILEERGELAAFSGSFNLVQFTARGGVMTLVQVSDTRLTTSLMIQEPK